MSDYRYVDEEGDVLVVRPSSQMDGTTLVRVEHPNKIAGMYVANADAPTVALELLKAAGQESVIVPKAYEEVIRNGAEITCGSGPEKAYGAASQNPNWLYNRAANYVALAQWIEGAAAREAAEKAEAEAVRKKLQERRDALAASYGWFGWKNLPNPARESIDYAIELEDKLAAK